MIYIDQIGNRIELNGVPKRIISLIPSQSEYLWDLGLQDQIVGISKFCIHPKEMFEQKVRVGGTKQLDMEKIRALKPDLIIGNKEENVKEQIEELQKEFNVWMSDVNTLDEAYDMMLQLGEICGKKNESEQMVEQIKEDLNDVKDVFKNKNAAYFIWYKPYMVVGSNTFIDEVLKYVGIKNCFANKSRYPETTLEELKQLQPHYVFLSSEPFPFQAFHLKELQQYLPATKVVLVDGEMFSWYGSHLLSLRSYILNLRSQLD
ncbi:MAG: ABC transporter substrate-binding protein [Sphingobacteriaceae bacterium]